MSRATPAVEIVGMHKRYGDGTEALRGIDLRVPAGGVFALLGRNGSGKTTTVRIMVGLTSSTSGTVTVLGHDMASERERVQARIGVTLQEAALDEVLTGREFLRFVARIQGRRRADAANRADELLELFGLQHDGDRSIGSYSGGMKRRLDLATALIRTPELLFLDEPTTGLDLQSRRSLWPEISRLRSNGTTVFLTTQYLEEAEALADEIAIIDRGLMIAQASPDELRRRHGRTWLVMHGLADTTAVAAAGGVDIETTNGSMRAVVADADDAMVVLGRLRGAGLDPTDVEIKRDSLEDIFLALTGTNATAGSTQVENVVG